MVTNILNIYRAENYTFLSNHLEWGKESQLLARRPLLIMEDLISSFFQVTGGSYH